MRLGVNIDHIATLREARRTFEPDPVAGAIICQLAGADGIVVHLREDRRHIKERDLKILKDVVKIKLNLEMAAAPEIIKIARTIKPEQATIVPERREEITTEGGLNVALGEKALKSATETLKESGISVSLFINADPRQIEASARLGVSAVELHTGEYAEHFNDILQREKELEKLKKGVMLARELGLDVYAGHGLTYYNVRQIASIPGLEELNIGHTIISRAVLVGLDRAVREMLELLRAQKE